MRYVSLLAVLVATAVAGAAPPEVSGPDKVYGELGDWVEIKVATEGKSVVFVPLDAGLKVFPAGKLRDPLSTMVRGDEAKAYRVLVYSGNAEGPSAPFIVTATFGRPTIPPGPVNPPTPPTPVDPFAKAVADAYAADVAPDKRERARALAGCMTRAAAYSADTTIATNELLAAKVGKDTRDTVADSLMGVRKEIGKYLGARFPSDAVALTPDMRKAFGEAYKAAAAAVTAAAQ